ncbi:MAG: hypothetical protein RBS72_18085 [Sedimentisphaerales bacterium]|jgi:hypothetical protein|nr:hypothetical protein [Sedimentisphaerales bacterium]HNY78457.1 hypothetical protein [Sedimentisphaerales bacterium]HOC63658.1 hypothetical protein [Sedimentisphaerales bacterium]HOH64403.1 hypothetical protein [Sedimentisphaerales bacterium]HPY49298.1 hypothetical protein [Sedimentisphaerales bacterium]
MSKREKRPEAAEHATATMAEPTADEGPAPAEIVGDLPAGGPVEIASDLPAVETVEDLSQRVRRFIDGAEKLRDAIEQRIRDIEHADREGREAYSEAQRLETVGDLAGSREALEEIGPARERAKELRASLADFGKDLGDLAAREPELRQLAAAAMERATLAIKEAEHGRARAAQTFGSISNGTATLAKVREILTVTGAIPEPAPPEPVEAPKSRKAGWPTCPRCRSTHNVERLGEDLFRCRAPYHGKLEFHAPRRPVGVGV